jgi:hypothetical protein
MPRNSKPANEAADTEKRPRPSTRGNGASIDHLNDPDEVARRAYEIYQRRGGEHGADLDDWLEAERQLKPGPSDVTGPAPARPKRRKPSDQSGL